MSCFYGENRLKSGNFFNAVQESILEVEAVMVSQADGHHVELEAAVKHLLSSGGKRIRPAVVLLTGRMLGGEEKRLITLGAAIEMLHTATLVHDDLIDGALLRRGMATLNSQWSPAATVLTGDFVFARAAKLAAETDSVPVIKLFAETLAIIVNGEITQMFTSRHIASREDYERRIFAKTASMFELATAAAAHLSPVSQPVIDSMRQFGYQLGMAFQIVDDVLDFTGEQATVGKPVASDLRQGLITLPALYYLADNHNDADMQAILAGSYMNDEQMDRVVGAIRESGAIDAALAEARLYIDRARSLLSEQRDCIEQHALCELADYVVSREI